MANPSGLCLLPIQQLPQTIVNVDRSYRYWEQGFLDELATWADSEYLLIKSDPTPEFLGAVAACPTKFPYLAIVRNMEEIKAAKDAADGKEIDLVGFEVLATSAHNPLISVQNLRALQKEGFAVWLNALSLENGQKLCGGFDDRTAIESGFDKGWGKLVDLGADIIQTDWPMLLKRYIDQRFSALGTAQTALEG